MSSTQGRHVNGRAEVDKGWKRTDLFGVLYTEDSLHEEGSVENTVSVVNFVGHPESGHNRLFSGFSSVVWGGEKGSERSWYDLQ